MNQLHSSLTHLNALKLDEKTKERVRRGLLTYGWNKPVISPSRVTWEITDKCNFFCKHCSASSHERKSSDISIESVFKIMDSLRLSGVDVINFTGGEVFTRSDFAEILKGAVQRGFRFSIASNLSLINEEQVNLLSMLQPINIQTSLDFGDEKSYDRFRGKKGAFSAFLKGLQLVLNKRLSVVATCTVTKQNFQQLDSIIDFAVSQKIPVFTLNDLIPTGRGKDIENQVLSQEEFIHLSEYMHEKRKQMEGKIYIAWHGVCHTPTRTPDSKLPIVISKCIACFTRLNISATGEVQACNLLKLSLGNILNQSLEEILTTSEEAKKFMDRTQLKGRCGDCDYKFSCGGCRARAYAYFQDYLAEDPRCISSNN